MRILLRNPKSLTPVFNREGITLYRGDCQSLYPSVVGRSCTHLLTDPPYGINLETQWRTKLRGRAAPSRNYPAIVGDNKEFDPSWIVEVILRYWVRAVLWGANYYANYLPSSKGWIVWNKNRPESWQQSHCEIAWTNMLPATRMHKHTWSGMMRASERGTHYHPAQKPVRLWTWIMKLEHFIRRGCQPADVLICDPYTGSGSTLIAAWLLGYRAVGIEISEAYTNIAVERIRKAMDVGREAYPHFF